MKKYWYIIIGSIIFLAVFWAVDEYRKGIELQKTIEAEIKEIIDRDSVLSELNFIKESKIQQLAEIQVEKTVTFVDTIVEKPKYRAMPLRDIQDTTKRDMVQPRLLMAPIEPQKRVVEKTVQVVDSTQLKELMRLEDELNDLLNLMGEIQNSAFLSGEVKNMTYSDIISEIKELITWIIGIMNTLLGMYLIYRKNTKQSKTESNGI